MAFPVGKSRVFRRGLEGHVAYATETAETSVAASAIAAAASAQAENVVSFLVGKRWEKCGKSVGKVWENFGTLRETL